MGSYQSYLRLDPQQQIHPHAQTHPYQPSHHPGLAVPAFGTAAGYPTAGPQIDLITRLFLLEKDLQIAQAENTKKEAVIQYLLNSKVSHPIVEDKAGTLKEEISSLKEKNARYEKDFQRIRSRLRKTLDTIFVLSTAKTISDGSRSSPVSGPCCTKAPETVTIKAEDLIDLSGSGEDIGGTKDSEEDTTLLDDSYDDLSEFEGPLENAQPVSNLTNLFSSDSTEDSAYIRHFINDGGSKKSDKATKMVATLAASVTQHIRMPSPESDNSSQNYSSSPSGPVSASTSFSSHSQDEAIAVGTWKEATSNAEVDSAGLLPQKWTLRKALGAMKALNYPLPLIDIIKEAGMVPDASKKTSDMPVPPSKATPGRSTEFFDPKERHQAMKINRREAGAMDLRFPDLFRYGVRFNPNSNESNVYRTVRISGLPSDTTIMKLLEKVRGGMVLDAKLLDTKSITGDMTGLVIFLHEYAAMAYEEHAQQHPISFNGLVARIETVSTPTWPIPINQRKAINDGTTRCFEVHNFPRTITPVMLRKELAVCQVVKFNAVESMSMSSDDVLGLRFSSVSFAGQASALFNCTRRYKGCVARFVPDPCAQPLETLLDDGALAHDVLKEDSLVASEKFDPELVAIDESRTSRLAPEEFESGLEASDTIKEFSSMATFEPDPELIAIDDSGRLTPVEWESKLEVADGQDLEVVE